MLNQLIQNSLKEFEDKFSVMLERANRENGESSEEWMNRIESFFQSHSEKIAKAYAEEVVREAVGTKKTIKDFQMSYDLLNVWETCRQSVLKKMAEIIKR